MLGGFFVLAVILGTVFDAWLSLKLLPLGHVALFAVSAGVFGGFCDSGDFGNGFARA
jgi:hypothetical protein